MNRKDFAQELSEIVFDFEYEILYKKFIEAELTEKQAEVLAEEFALGKASKVKEAYTRS